MYSFINYIYNKIFYTNCKVQVESSNENIKNKSDIINTICDYKLLDSIQLINIKKLSHDSLLDIVKTFNDNIRHTHILLKDFLEDDK